MFANVGVVRSTLECDVERRFEAKLLGFGDEPIEVLESTQLRVNRLVAAIFRSYRPGTADIAGFSGKRIVLTLAERTSDRVNRREVHDVKTHRSNIS